VTSVVDRTHGGPSAPPGTATGRDGWLSRWGATLAVAVVVVLRLPYLWAPMTSDEGGFLAVAAQWRRGGGSLYGSYWVDRPPLLITVYQLASQLGGLTALRLIGCGAAALTVWCSAAAAGHIAGPRARSWTALVAALLMCSPLLGALEIDGELLAAPFVAAAVLLAVRALDTGRATAARRAAFTAGTAALAAVLIKQNMVDGAVFTVVAWGAAWWSGVVTGRRLRELLWAFSAGALCTVLAVVVWAEAHGTSPVGVFDAMYPFRVKAAQVISASGSTTDALRLHHLVEAWLFSGLPLVVLALLWHALRDRPRQPWSLGLLAMLGFAAFSIGGGGNFWSHYLVETIVPTSVAAGLVVGRRVRLARPATVVVVVLAAVAWWTGLQLTVDAPGPATGRSLAAVAAPGDTVLSAFGDGDIVRASGLRSPYPYLWSLPTHTLDPSLRRLDAILRGPDAPTWLVVRGPATLDYLTRHTGSVVPRRYHRVGMVCGRSIYLLDGLNRPVPRQHTSCRAPVAGPVARVSLHWRW
jgi:hypothetical protein